LYFVDNNAELLANGCPGLGSAVVLSRGFNRFRYLTIMMSFYIPPMHTGQGDRPAPIDKCGADKDLLDVGLSNENSP
jgi:hypothetical protein